MFYQLSKLLDFLIMPYNVLLIGLIVVVIRVKSSRLKWLTGLIFLGLYAQSNAYLVSSLYKIWEVPPGNLNALRQEQYDIGIVLSGGLLNSCTPASAGYFDLDSGSDRLLSAYLLYKNGVCRRLLLTGSDHDDLLSKGIGEVQLAKRLLVGWGVPENDIILETKARNTYENARYTSEKLLTLPSHDNLLLITSAYHMRRAKACFMKAGIDTDVFPTDFWLAQSCLPAKMKYFPEPRASAAFHKLWREWIGMVMYKLAGYC